jgi:uncharacterized protein YcbK (DUF882 family)
MRYFSIAEFDSPDAPGSGVNMHQDLLELLDEIRAIYGKPIVITSGYRTPEHNASLGKNASKNSSHLKGLAVDIAIENSNQRYEIIRIAMLLGIKRIGTGKGFVHIDIDASKPSNVNWVY